MTAETATHACPRRRHCSLLVARRRVASHAQTYPDKPVKIIVAVAAGGPMDTMARAVAQQMQAKLGQPVVVENRPGAGTTIGAKAVVTAEPDGLTLLWGTLSMVAIAPVLYKDLDFDPKQLVPVALVAEFPSVLVIPPSLPVNTLAEFIAYAKANRGKLNYGGSLGTPPMLMGMQFNKVADLGMTYVPYRGGAPSIPDLIAGRLHMQFDALTLLVPLIKEGKLRALAVQTPERWPDAARRADAARGGLRRFPGQRLGRHHGAAEDAAARSSASSTPPSTTSCSRRRPRPTLDQAQRAAAAGHRRRSSSAFIARETPAWSAMVRKSGATAH